MFKYVLRGFVFKIEVGVFVDNMGEVGKSLLIYLIRTTRVHWFLFDSVFAVGEVERRITC